MRRTVRLTRDSSAKPTLIGLLPLGSSPSGISSEDGYEDMITVTSDLNKKESKVRPSGVSTATDQNRPSEGRNSKR